VDHKPRVLLFSTSDSTRSQMAEGFLRKFAGEELAVVSTAVQSSDSDLLAAEVMKENGVDISDKDPYKCTIAQVRKEDRSALDLL
jgi:protein-tyrosine-phosphatase